MILEAVRPRLPAITSLRFFAAFHVALFHMNEMGAITGRIGSSHSRQSATSG